MAYELQVTGIGSSYQEQLRRQVQFPECGVGLSMGYLLVHRQIQNGMVWVYQRRTPPTPPPGEAQTYWVSLPAILEKIRCPVEDCQGKAKNWNNLRVHFENFHVRDTIVILEDGNLPYPRYPKCDMVVA